KVKIIKEMTKKQEAMISVYREKFLNIGLSTEPGNKELAKEAISDCYRLLGKEKPKYFFWFDSPMAAIIAANFLSMDFKGGQLRDQLRDQLWDQLRGQLRDQLEDQLRGQLRGQLW